MGSVLGSAGQVRIMKKHHEHIGLVIAGILGVTSLGLVASALWPWWSVQLTQPHNSSVQSVKPVVALLPHQDDEMFMAGILRRYVGTGRPVYAVVVTDGGGSAARRMLNGETPDTRSQSKRRFFRHQPKAEGYAPLSVQEFSAARNREVLASLQILGIPVTHILFANDGGVNGTSSPQYRDSQLSVREASEAIAKVYAQLGDGTYLTLASGPGEAHFRNPDHWNLQKALQSFPGVSEKIYFADIPDKAEVITLSSGEREAKQAALQNYYTWDPSSGRFAVGEHSVAYLLDRWQTSTVEYVIRKN